MDHGLVLLALSVLVQFAAAVVAASHIRAGERSIGWVLISGALLLVAVRRALALLGAGAELPLAAYGGVLTEGLGLAISVMLLLGVAWVGVVLRRARVHAEEVQELADALAAQEGRYEVLIDHLPVAVAVLQDGRLTFVNAAFGQVAGVPRDHVTGVMLENLVAEEQQESFRRWLMDLATASGTPAAGRTEWQLRDSRGGRKWVACRGRRGSWGGREALFLTATDITEWVAARTELQESEAKFRALAETAGCAIFIVQDDHLRYVNPQAVAMSGFSREELLSRPFWELVHEDDRASVRTRGIGHEVGEGPDPPLPVRLLSGRGEVRWINFNAARMVFEGEPAIIGTAFDVTEERETEEEVRRSRDRLEEIVAERTARLRASEETFRALAENSVDVIMRFDRECRHLYVNPVVESQTGIPVDRFIGRTHAELGFPAELVEVWEASIRGVFGTGESSRIEFELPNHIWIDWMLIPEFDSSGSVSTVITTARDITARKRGEQELEELVERRTAELLRTNERLEEEIEERRKVEQALRASEERFRSLYDNASIGLYRSTPDGRVIMANPALVRMLGLASFEDLAARNLEEESFYADVSRREFCELLESSGELLGFETAWRRGDGTTVAVRENAKVVRDRNGKVLYYEGTVEDVTSARRLEEQLRQGQRLEAVGQLAGGIAHDFNNLMMAVLGSAELLRQRLPADELASREVEVIQRSAERASDLTRGLLAFARRQVLEPVELDLNQVVDELLPMLRRLIPESITIDFEPGPAVSTVRADRGNVDQVLVNLCVNARDAMPQGGSIRIRTSTALAGELRPHVAAPLPAGGRFALLELTDTGIGMDEETRSHIFEPFFTTKERGRGTGMGLATVYGIVTQHGGFVDVRSEEGRGATFRVFLPAVTPAQAPPTMPAPIETAGGGETILVAEDQAEVRRVLVEALTYLGYRVLEAADGEEALALLRRQPAAVHLVLADVVMPRMGGLELYRAVCGEWPSVRFLFSSGYGEDLVQESAHQTAPIHFIAKPYRIEMLARKVRAVLDEATPGG